MIIGRVLSSMSFSDFVSAAERAERERKANERLANIETAEVQRQAAAAAHEQDELAKERRPEYRSVKNAKSKNKRYERHIRFVIYEQTLEERRAALRVSRVPVAVETMEPVHASE